jgi:hypothetical protein
MIIKKLSRRILLLESKHTVQLTHLRAGQLTSLIMDPAGFQARPGQIFALLPGFGQSLAAVAF